MVKVRTSQEAWDKIREIVGGIPDDVDEIHVVNETMRMKRTESEARRKGGNGRVLGAGGQAAKASEF